MTPPTPVARLLAPLLDGPASSAVLFDLDGTLAPIVPHPADARLMADARPLLEVVRDRYGLLGFVSGRSLAELEEIVALDGVGYSGNHGMEVRRPGGAPEGIAGAVEHAGAIAAFRRAWSGADLEERGVWVEDKTASLSFHYRRAPDPDAARAYLDEHVRPAAEVAGLRAGWGRAVLEVLPTVPATKGSAVRALVADTALRRAAYFGDDRTDIDAWAALRDLRAAGRLEHVACVLAGSSETAPAVRAAADAEVAGPAGVLGALRMLAGQPDT